MKAIETNNFILFIRNNFLSVKKYLNNNFVYIPVLISVIYLLIFQSASLAQENEYRFSYITTINGLSNNIVNCIVQDSQGYMWIGTSEGLNRYDGLSNKIFTKDIKDSTSIADNIIYQIFIDHLNNLWVGTENGICKYNSHQENFKSYLPDPEKNKIIVANRITGIKESTDKKLYVSTENGYLYCYNPLRNTFEKDIHFFKSIRCFTIGRNNQFWLGGVDGLYFYDKNSGEIKHFNSFIKESENFASVAIRTILEEGDTIWIGTNKGELYYLLKNNMQIKLLNYKFDNTYYISDIFKDRKGLLYISTASGIFIYNKTTNKFISYKYELNNPSGLNCLDVTKTYEDSEGNLWVGTFQGGINLAVKGKKFKNYDNFSKEFSLDATNVHSINIDYKGNLWIGSFNQGINVINLNTGKKRFYLNNENEPYTLSQGSVYTIFEDSKKNTWVGTYMGYLQRYDPQSDKFISYPLFPENKNLKGNTDIRSIIEDNDGNLWFLSHGFGMIKFNPETKIYKSYRSDENNPAGSLPNNWSFQLLIDHENFIWIASPSGLTKYNIEKETFQNFIHSTDDSASLCNNFVNVIYEDLNQNLWVGTSFGLDLLNRKNNQFIHFHKEDGLPSNHIKSILENKAGELWISTNYGISRLKYEKDPKTDKLKTHFRNYNVSDNLQDNFYWERSASKTKNGEMVFGCSKGIVMFYPNDIKDDTVIPKVYLTGFKLFNKMVNIGEYDSLLRQSINQTKEIKLKYNQNIFSFEFVGIDYISRDNNQYAYKMEGFDKDWNFVGTKHEATYTNLDPGDYIFRVKASNNDNYWNEKGISIKLTITPPFWKTWWFKILDVIIIISLGLFYYFFRINILNKQKVILENRIEKRTHDLLKANNELVEKNNWILAQNEEITSQNQEIYNKNEEISIQKELLEDQKSKIEKAYVELSQYRNKLEDLVEERTKELSIAKEKAEESDRLKSSFLANFSHEIRTPLNSIIGFSSLISTPDISKNEQQTYKSIIESSSNTLLNLINDIIDFSKIEAGHLDILLKEVRLDQVLNDIYEIFNYEIKKLQWEYDKKLYLKVNVDDNIKAYILITDETRLKQILSNLISNAIKYTDDGSIEVGCKKSDHAEMLEFYVKDTGIGIKKEYQEIIFQRFRKVEDNSDMIYRGTGLGLTICRHLIALLGGEIRVESTLGEGSTFYFTLPFKETGKTFHTKLISDFSHIIPDLHDILILVAEDDYSNYSYIEKLLQKTKANILRAVNGKQVIDLLQANPKIKLILMDIKMPEMNGIEALLEIKKLNIKVPVVAQTAYAFSDEVQKINDAGFDDYITKPISPEVLFSCLNKYLWKKTSL